MSCSGVLYPSIFLGRLFNRLTAALPVTGYPFSNWYFWKVLTERFIGIFIQSPFPGTIWAPKIERRRRYLTDFFAVGKLHSIVCSDAVNGLPEWSQHSDRGQGDICRALAV